MDTCAHVDIYNCVCMCACIRWNSIPIYRCVCMQGCVAYNRNVCSVHICVAAHQISVSEYMLYIYWLIRKLLLYQSDMICIEDGPKLVSFVFFSLSRFWYSSSFSSSYAGYVFKRFTCIVLSRIEKSVVYVYVDECVECYIYSVLTECSGQCFVNIWENNSRMLLVVYGICICVRY